MKQITINIQGSKYNGDILCDNEAFQLVRFDGILPIESSDYEDIKTFFPNFRLEIGEYMNDTYRICCGNSVMLTESESKSID